MTLLLLENTGMVLHHHRLRPHVRVASTAAAIGFQSSQGSGGIRPHRPRIVRITTTIATLEVEQRRLQVLHNLVLVDDQLLRLNGLWIGDRLQVAVNLLHHPLVVDERRLVVSEHRAVAGDLHILRNLPRSRGVHFVVRLLHLHKLLLLGGVAEGDAGPEVVEQLVEGAGQVPQLRQNVLRQLVLEVGGGQKTGGVLHQRATWGEVAEGGDGVLRLEDGSLVGGGGRGGAGEGPPAVDGLLQLGKDGARLARLRGVAVGVGVGKNQAPKTYYESCSCIDGVGPYMYRAAAAELLATFSAGGRTPSSKSSIVAPTAGFFPARSSYSRRMSAWFADSSVAFEPAAPVASVVVPPPSTFSSVGSTWSSKTRRSKKGSVMPRLIACLMSASSWRAQSLKKSFSELMRSR
ncbi:hypothetical protein TYRP_012743 [Tyrophagus putrescentiae]|nr:hypothetical protein TYRP_012743 [Tyrophagus putrescentiae]